VHPNLWVHLDARNQQRTHGSLLDGSGNGRDFLPGSNLTPREMTRACEGNRSLSSANLAIKAGGSVLAKTTTASVHIVQGVPVSIAADTDMPALTGMAVNGGDNGLATFYVDRAGALSVVITPSVLQGAALVFPATPENRTCIGYIRVSRTSGTFTGGATALDAASTTTTYASPVDPEPGFGRVFGPRLGFINSSGYRDTILHGPSINFDYDGGEVLLILAMIRGLPPAADTTLIGNSGANTLNGWRIRTRTTGNFDLALYSATGSVASFSGNSTATVLDGRWHQVGAVFDGRNKVRHTIVDGVSDRLNIGALAACNTREDSGLHIGGIRALPSNITTEASDIDIESLIVMRWGPTDTVPTIENMIAFAARQMRAGRRVPAAGDL
jgi:hypothetical protein